MEVVDTCNGVTYDLSNHFIYEIYLKDIERDPNPTVDSTGFSFRTFGAGLVFAPKESSLFIVFHLMVIVFLALVYV